MLNSAKEPATTFTIDSSASVKMAFDRVMYQAVNLIASKMMLITNTTNMALIFLRSFSEIKERDNIQKVKFIYLNKIQDYECACITSNGISGW